MKTQPQSESAERCGLPIQEEVSHIVPLIIGESSEALRVASRVRAAGFEVRAVRPPTVTRGTSRLRLSLNASLSNDEISEAANVLADTIKSVER